MTLTKCRKCGSSIIKKEVIDSGNIKFQLWKCRSCGFDNAEVIKPEESKKDFLDF